MPRAKRSPDSRVLFIRTDDETEAQLTALAKAWSPVLPANHSDIAREAIRRAFAAEQKSAKKSSSIA